MPRSTSTTAFSLVELLVVIAIMVLLIALLMPALRQAREAAKATACMSNLKQISYAFPMYHAEFRNWFPVGSGWSAASHAHLRAPTWARVAAHTLGLPYITEQSVASLADYGHQAQSYTLEDRPNGIFQCPSDNFPNAWGGKNATTYRYNAGHDNGMGWGFGSSDYYRVRYPAKGSYGDTAGRVRTNQVKKAATTFIIGESRMIRDQPAVYAAEYVPTQFRYTNHGGDWHNDGGNYLWGDGHATRMHADALNADHFDRRR